MIQVLDRFKALVDASDGTAPPEAEQSLFASQTLDGRWRVDGDLAPAAGHVVATALRVAERPNDPSELRTAGAGAPMRSKTCAGSSSTTRPRSRVGGTGRT